MKNNLTIQIVTALMVLLCALLVLNPFGILMPSMTAMFFLAALFVVFCVFSAFVLREKPADEREEQHRALSGRIAFLAGSSLLVLGIVVTDLGHMLDPWLVVVLAGMILAKLVTRIYSDREL